MNDEMMKHYRFQRILLDAARYRMLCQMLASLIRSDADRRDQEKPTVLAVN